MKYIELTPENCDFYGMDKEFNRLPEDFAKSISQQVYDLSREAAGGRIRFSLCNSSVLGIRAQIEKCNIIGFDMFECRKTDGKEIFFAGFRRPDCFICTGSFEPGIKSIKEPEMTHYFTLNMPYNANVAKLELCVDDNAVISHGLPYIGKKPVVFYGSSITTGAWASRPGLSYEALLSQKYNLDYLNFGFSGNAKGEPEMAEYLAGFDMSMFVLDYDHNAPTPEHLEKTHLDFYRTVRRAHPDIPILLLTRPDYFSDRPDSALREEIVKKTFEYAKSRSENVYFISGKTFFEGEFYHNCTRDGCHPNDIGFYRMFTSICPVMEKALVLPSGKFDDNL